MAKSHIELDFFGLHRPSPHPRLDRRQSFRGISKMNPEIVKNIIASSSNKQVPTENVTKSETNLPANSVSNAHHHPLSGEGGSVKTGETAPMTIFYNGSVSVFDLPKDKAEYIMKLAMEKNISINNDGQIVDHSSCSSETNDNILGPLNDGDMPIKRKKSLQRFFEKRKERLIWVSPYGSRTM